MPETGWIRSALDVLGRSSTPLLFTGSARIILSPRDGGAADEPSSRGHGVRTPTGTLERWVRSKAITPYRLVERCQIILLSAAGMNNAEQGRLLNVDRQRPRRWRRRWAAAEERLSGAEAEGASDRDLAALVADALNDRKRPGGPPTFSAEQLTKIIALACELPEESDRPVTHWTPRELAAEATRRGIVDSISPTRRASVRQGPKRTSSRTSPGRSTSTPARPGSSSPTSSTPTSPRRSSASSPNGAASSTTSGSRGRAASSGR